jgi:uncharacterized damage-inducible protein DinB
MSIAQSFLPEFDHEMATTRRLLERTPEANADWQPHPKSMTLSKLAIHLATLPMWGTMTVRASEFDMNPPEGQSFKPPTWAGHAALLATFDAAVKEAREAIAGASDAELMAPWALKNGGHVVFSLPRVAVLRSFMMNHIIHHRGQYSVYLRLNDVPVPSIYGPTADEAN